MGNKTFIPMACKDFHTLKYTTGSFSNVLKQIHNIQTFSRSTCTSEQEKVVKLTVGTS